MKIGTATPEAFKLMMEGMVVLSEVEHAGIRVNEKRLDKQIETTGKQITALEDKIRSDPIFKLWSRRFGNKAWKLDGDQLAQLLFQDMGFDCPARSDKKARTDGLPNADQAAFESVDLPVVHDFIHMEKLRKVRNTFLLGIKREVVDGIVHPFQNLHTTKTYRSSSNAPNGHNFPGREAEFAEIVRSVFEPRSHDRRIGEHDLSGAEVCISACYNLDENLISYIKDKAKDMHRDMSYECFLMTPEEMGPTDKGCPGKQVRNVTKNKFVFPQFYGSYYVDCARALWQEAVKLKLTTADGTSILKHLRRRGIKSLGDLNPEVPPRKGTFEYHIQQVEKPFWEERFAGYTEWKRRWWEKYQQRGWFRMKTGFVCSGVMKRNDVLNYPVQGSSFHCLLWCLIRVQKWLKKNKMKTLVVGQIHDSIIGDVHRDEYDDYLGKVTEVITKDLPRHWPWIIVPMTVEAEFSPPGENWFKKQKVHS